ncbi:hypothetical protein ACRAKJ_21470 [Saccharothrix sp. DSM 118769]
MSVALVFVHGILSDRGVWSDFDRLVAADPALTGVDVLHFEYFSPKAAPLPAQRIPDIDDCAKKLGTFLELRTGRHSSIALVSHSQGGLIVQRYLVSVLERGRGEDLARIGHVVMFACPNNGSEFVKSLRRVLGAALDNPQERSLRVLDKQVTKTQSIVLNRIVNARSKGPAEYPVPVDVYAGEKDNVVLPQSALSYFPEGHVISGDHSSVVRPETSDSDAYVALRRHVLPLLDEVPAIPPPDPWRTLGVRRTGTPRTVLIDAVRRSLDAGDRLVVLFGLPRSGKTTVLCDAVTGLTGWASVSAHRADGLDAEQAARIVDEVRAAPAPRLVVLDGIAPGTSADDLAEALSLEPDTAVVATSSAHPGPASPARTIAVRPLDADEVRAIIAHESGGGHEPVDGDRLVGFIPGPVAALPGSLRAFVAESLRTPVRLLVAQPLPEAVLREIRPVAALVAGTDPGDRRVLASFVATAGVPLSGLLDAGLVVPSVAAPALRRLNDLALVAQGQVVVEVPAVVVSVLPAEDLRAAFADLAAAVRAAAGPADGVLGRDLAAALPVLARNALEHGEFAELEAILRDGLADRVNRQGHWPDYLAVTRVLIDALDAQGDHAGGVALRCRLVRKVAQQGDLELAGALLHEAEQRVGEHGSAKTRAELHSHRAFLALRQGDSAYAEREARRSVELYAEQQDEHGQFVGLKLLGNIHLRLGEHEVAAEHFRSALDRATPADAPQRLEAEINLALCDMESGRPEQAAARLDALINRMWAGTDTELPRALHLRALLAEEAGFPAQALHLVRRAAAEWARDPAVREAVARTLWRMERFGAGHSKWTAPGPVPGSEIT